MSILREMISTVRKSKENLLPDWLAPPRHFGSPAAESGAALAVRLARAQSCDLKSK